MAGIHQKAILSEMNRTFFLSCLAFGALNFLGLAIGGMATGPGVASDWYASLEKAPWTPPGWVFGAAWTLVMLGFTVFIAHWWAEAKLQGKSASVLRLFALAWVLNVAWNPLFFGAHQAGWALLEILTLFAVILALARQGWSQAGVARWGILPYLIWLCVATSLNGFVVWANP